MIISIHFYFLLESHGYLNRENQTKWMDSLNKLTKRLQELQKKRTENKGILFTSFKYLKFFQQDRIDVTVSREKLKRLSGEIETYEREVTK